MGFLKNVFAGVIIFALFAGCVAQPSSMPTTISVPQPTITLLPTVASTVTPRETATPTSTPNAHLTVNCLKPLPELPPNAQLQGTLALGTFYRRTNQGYLLNLETGKKTPILGRDDEILHTFSVSPDARWLAYTSYRTKAEATERLVVMGANGKPVKDRLFSTREWIYMDGWVNNQDLLFEKYDRVNYDRWGGPLSTVVYNPFSTEQKLLDPNNYPDIQSYGQRLYQWPYTETIYDPSLSFVLYPHSDGETIIFWDIANNKEIARFARKWFDDGLIPVWSPDGSLMLKLDSLGPASQAELYSMNKNGVQTRLTYISFTNLDLWPGFFSWSPDMQYIAFWFTNRKDDSSHLAVLDMKTNHVTDYCLEGLDHYKNLYGIMSAPKWSPDSHKLLINTPDGQDKTKVVVVDLLRGYAAIVAENMMAIGWLTNQP